MDNNQIHDLTMFYLSKNTPDINTPEELAEKYRDVQAKIEATLNPPKKVSTSKRKYGVVSRGIDL
ncbi:hypothetical protein [Chengkuizengella axinellae]|uniref:Uncharacterized protein n=1 Tax=Chengkuizengella axinellae TaxID=3064388 RepID=A0ABT9J8A2_9BACL|nr:hypothetical protein [Chengkuizengella sp. 2205SS18-9]MDP5277154.1 hypothetical protein [Chengkuizengella sp. 2205SS18-9]